MATIESLAPVTETGEIELEVEGRLPAELAGSYLRDGPNRTPAQGIAGLWLDGQGMVSDGPTVHVVGCRRRVPGVHRGEENPFEASAGSLRRCSIDERTGGVEETDIDDDPCDFPSLFPGGSNCQMLWIRQ
jgi:carotenoid cleavage dioxygenase-like enzyme